MYHQRTVHKCGCGISVEQAAFRLRSWFVAVIQVDGTADPVLQKRFATMEYPSIYYLRGEETRQYRGERTTEHVRTSLQTEPNSLQTEPVIFVSAWLLLCLSSGFSADILCSVDNFWFVRFSNHPCVDPLWSRS